jgi:PhnB protein
MAVRPIPKGYHTVTPYLVNGGVAGVVDFLQKAFGAKQTHPPMARPDGTILHTEVKIGSSHVMLGEPMGNTAPIPGSLYRYVKDVGATYRRAEERARQPARR